MADYTVYVLPMDSFDFGKTGWGVDRAPWNPWGGGGYNAPTGGSWNDNGPWNFTLSKAGAVPVEVTDNDISPGTLDDDSWWDTSKGGPGSQVINTQIGYARPGYDIADEYEIKVSAVVDGIVKEYTMVALTAYGPSDHTVTNANYIGFTFEGEWPPEGAVLTYVQNSNADDQSLNIADVHVPCFVRDTQIQTPHGQVAIQDLRPGDLVLTRDHGPQPLRWVGARGVSAPQLATTPRLRPIRIRAGALGQGVPVSDLLVSPQHRILVRSQLAAHQFCADEVLLPAVQLLPLAGVELADEMVDVTYFHMLFDRHEVVIANGAETESLFTGPWALKSLGAEAVDEIYALFPDLRDRDYTPSAARVLVSGPQAGRLVARHVRTHKPLVA
ncbi:MAG TPA: Hint domain-containing protein [Paenirhodobacter sp.]